VHMREPECEKEKRGGEGDFLNPLAGMLMFRAVERAGESDEGMCADLARKFEAGG